MLQPNLSTLFLFREVKKKLIQFVGGDKEIHGGTTRDKGPQKYGDPPLHCVSKQSVMPD